VRGRLEKGRVFSTFLLPSHCAAFLNMTLAVSVGAWWRSRNPWGRASVLGALALQAAALYLTKSFSGFVSLIAAGSVAAAVYMIYVRHAARRRLAYVGVGAVVVLAVLVMGASLQRADNPFASMANNPSLLRLLNWEAALRMIQESPWRGSGLHTFGLLYPSFQEAGANVVHHAHNSYLQVGVEMGIAGLAAFGWFAGWWIWRAVKAVRAAGDAGEGLWRSCLLAAGLAFLMHNALDFEFYLPSVTLPGFAVLALVVGEGGSGTRMIVQAGGKRKMLVLGVGFTLALIASLTLTVQVYARMHYDKARYMLNATGVLDREAAHELEQAIRLDPRDSRYHHRYGVLLFRDLARPHEGIAAVERAVNLSPRRHHYRFDLGMMYLLSGNRQKGLGEIERAVEINPGNDTYRELLDRLREESHSG